MKQRVVIAMALACEPELLIADEPTTALDVTIQAQVLLLMRDLRDRLGTSMIMITHDLGIVAQTCDKVAIMYAGELFEIGSLEEIFNGGAAPSLHVRTVQFHPEPEYGGCAPQHHIGFDAGSHRFAEGVPLPSALPIMHGNMQGKASRLLYARFPFD